MRTIVNFIKSFLNYFWNYHFIMFKKISLLSAILFILSVPAVATVQPGVEQMVEESDIILIGQVISVDQSNQAYQVITIEPHEYLKGKSEISTMPLHFRYVPSTTYPGIGFNKNFQLLVEKKSKLIFYLKKSDNMLALTEDWFGIEDNDSRLIELIKKFVETESAR